MEVDDFVEAADDARLGHFSVGFEVYVVCDSLVVGLVRIEVKEVVVAAGAETFCV